MHLSYSRYHFLRRWEKCTCARSLVLVLYKWEFNTGFPETVLVNCENLSELLAYNIEEKLRSLLLPPVNSCRVRSLLLRSKCCPLTITWLRGSLQSYSRGLPLLLKMKYSSTLTYIFASFSNSSFCDRLDKAPETLRESPRYVWIINIQTSQPQYDSLKDL